MEWKDRLVFVSGAGGFIGSHLVEALAARGARVRAFVRYNSRGDWGYLGGLAPELSERVEIVAGDLRDADAVARALRDTTVAFHLGAMIAIPYSYVHPREVADVNIFGTLNVLTAARELKLERVVHTSTSEVYGTAQYVPIDEKHPLVGQSPYSASKTAADQLADSFCRSYDLPVAIARPFNTYGPRQSARAVIPTVISQALAGGRLLIGARHPTRDLNYVSDTVRGFLRIAECPEAVGQVVNFGTGREISVGDLVDTIVRLVGKPVEVVVDPARLRPGRSEVERLLADNRKAQQLLGWAPEVSLEDGLARTIEWMRRHASLYRPREYAV
jgi:NAD dependent epimerase/dehydratase